MLRGFIAPTDHAWWRFLQARPDLDEVNFWRPAPGRFRALSPGEPFLFKLKRPYNAIGGFGLFARFEAMPLWRAWDVFGPANGAPDRGALLNSLERWSPSGAMTLDHVIGCVAVAHPVFFAPDEWVAQPHDWQPNVMRGTAYDLSHGEGKSVWGECLARAATRAAPEWVLEAADAQRTGRPLMITPRLGQASFRLAVLEAYQGACAVTTEHSLPVVDAAHIRPWAAGGGHVVPNGLPLRSDLHRLFDLGFVTVRPGGRFCVSPELREAYANGRTYYALEGRQILLPADARAHPSSDALLWHSETVFRS